MRDLKPDDEVRYKRINTGTDETEVLLGCIKYVGTKYACVVDMFYPGLSTDVHIVHLEDIL